MNWQNYDRLVMHLKAMPPSGFDYGNDFMDKDAGCLACQCVYLGDISVYGRGAGPWPIWKFLSVNDAEANYLFGVEGIMQDGGPAPWQCGKSIGQMGIREALRRLAVVAARYQRPVTEPEAVAVVPDDAAFLKSVYALVRGPLVDARGE